MKIHKWFLSGAAFALGALLLSSPESSGFSTNGGVLGLSQRDFRVRDTFLDVSANNNGQDDPQFPGYSGAELAIWKGTVEWGSGRHGDGSGDPTQPQIGNGGADFDSTWQGLSTGIGTTNDNVVSASSTNPSCGGGTLAFTELPVTDGWRIIFCDAGILWEDGPGLIGGSSFDIQEVQAHEYGHALGLGHSADNNATMRPSTPPGSEVQRSINNDDIAGVQFIYGAKSASKPEITAVSVLCSNTLQITGFNFDATNNEVWFTRESLSSIGNPTKAFGVASTGAGTLITVDLPSDASSVGGDLLVRIPGSGGDKLSDAFPFEPGEATITYCTAKTTSQGCLPFLDTGGAGLPSLSDTNAFNIVGNDHAINNGGLLVYGFSKTNLDFHGGKLCVKSPIRTAGKIAKNKAASVCTLVTSTGRLTTNFNNRIQGGLDPLLTAGQKVYAQWQQRDTGNTVGGFADSLSNGIRFTICP